MGKKFLPIIMFAGMTAIGVESVNADNPCPGDNMSPVYSNAGKNKTCNPDKDCKYRDGDSFLVSPPNACLQGKDKVWYCCYVKGKEMMEKKDMKEVIIKDYRKKTPNQN
ncbi:MAG: hypothetical protein KBD90_02630 [Alphaproteobacteria bacterium]|nr:hypothetical protein [Alphaproteobacteria bacterium]